MTEYQFDTILTGNKTFAKTSHLQNNADIFDIYEISIKLYKGTLIRRVTVGQKKSSISLPRTRDIFQ